MSRCTYIPAAFLLADVLVTGKDCIQAHGRHNPADDHGLRCSLLLFGCIVTLTCVQEHLQSLGSLQKLVDSLIDSTSHPHAIDGAALCCSVLPADDTDVEGDADKLPQAAQPNACGVDIVQLLQVSFCCFAWSPAFAALSTVHVNTTLLLHVPIPFIALYLGWQNAECLTEFCLIPRMLQNVHVA